MRFKFKIETDNETYLATNYQSFANHFDTKVARIKYLLKTGKLNIEKTNITLQEIMKNDYNYQVNASGVVIIQPKTYENGSDTDTDTV